MKAQVQNVPIPARMQQLECDARGYPIPFNIWRDTDGVAHFTINDHEKAAKDLLVTPVKVHLP